MYISQSNDYITIPTSCLSRVKLFI